MLMPCLERSSAKCWTGEQESLPFECLKIATCNQEVFRAPEYHLVKPTQGMFSHVWWTNHVAILELAIEGKVNVWNRVNEVSS